VDFCQISLSSLYLSLCLSLAMASVDQVRASETGQKRYAEFSALVAASVMKDGECATVKRYGCTRGFARYHGEKLRNARWHDGRWGGSNGNARNEAEIEELQRFALWQEVTADPLRTIQQFRTTLRRNGFDVSDSWVKRCFVRWGISRQKPSYRNLNKFAISNIIYYRYDMEVPSYTHHSHLLSLERMSSI